MSRCSLRLDNGPPISSSSFSVGGASRSRSLRPRRSSLSESILRPPPPRSSVLSSCNDVSDASLLSSLMDQSSVQESTLLHSLWGLDQDVDANGGAAADDTVLKRTPCISYCDSSSDETETCTIYTRGRSRRGRTDVTLSGVMKSTRAAAHFLSLPLLTWWAWLRSKVTQEGRGATSNLDATMIPEESDTDEGHTHNSLCEDCQEKQRSEAGGSSSSVVSRLLALTCSAAVLTGRTLIGFLQRLSISCRDIIVDLRSTGFAEWRSVLFLPLFLLLLWLCCFGPAGLTSICNICEQSVATLAPETSNGPPVGEAEETVDYQMERLDMLERRLETLMRRVEVGRQWAEQRSRKVLMELRRERRVSAEDSETRRRLWEVQGLLEETRQQSAEQLLTQNSRLERLELLLQTPSDTTTQVQTRDANTLPAALSAAELQPSHDALLVEVSRLETALEDVRRDVKSVKCEDVCPQLTAIQQMVSTQISSELRPHVLTLLYGSELASGYAITPESLLQWISKHYVSVSDLQEALFAMEHRILLSISAEQADRATLESAEPAGSTVTSEDVSLMISEALQMFSQDRTGLADYALESGGGSILSTRCSETYETKAALLTLFGFPLWYFSQSPRVVIQPDVHLGNCWPFRGSSGFLVIRLSMNIFPSAFSMEHVPKALTADGRLLSAPRHFEVYGLHDEADEDGTLLGTFTFEHDGDALQTFGVTEENSQSFQIIELKVLSNWGHPDYTCLYRFRVHGTPSNT